MDSARGKEKRRVTNIETTPLPSKKRKTFIKEEEEEADQDTLMHNGSSDTTSDNADDEGEEELALVLPGYLMDSGAEANGEDKDDKIENEEEEDEDEDADEEADDSDDSDYIYDEEGLDRADRPMRIKKIKKMPEGDGGDAGELWRLAKMPVRGYELDDDMMEEVQEDGTVRLRKKNAEDVIGDSEYYKRAKAEVGKSKARRMYSLRINTIIERRLQQASVPYRALESDIPESSRVQNKYDANARVAFTVPTDEANGGPELPLPGFFDDDVDGKKKWVVRDGAVPTLNFFTNEWEVLVRPRGR